MLEGTGPSHWRKALRPLLRDRLAIGGMAVVICMIWLGAFAAVIPLRDPLGIDVGHGLEPPSSQHWFGSDVLGRDMLSRVVHGSRPSIWIGLASILVATTAGGALGLLSGYFGGPIDGVIGRVMDILFSFPTLLLAIVIATVLGPSSNNALIAIAIAYTPRFWRLSRAQVLTERRREYIDAARAIGASDWRIIALHVLPNILTPVAVQAAVGFSEAILAEATLSYLGLGTQPPLPSWGRMLSDGRSYLERAPWASLFPGSFIALTVLGFNLFADGVRDALDPRMR